MNRSNLPTLVFAMLTTAALAEGGFYGDPPDATHPWAIHDMNRPQPPRVEPGTATTAPSDAVVLVQRQAGGD
jgi:hypothetical protein